MAAKDQAMGKKRKIPLVMPRAIEPVLAENVEPVMKITSISGADKDGITDNDILPLLQYYSQAICCNKGDI